MSKRPMVDATYIPRPTLLLRYFKQFDNDTSAPVGTLIVLQRDDFSPNEVSSTTPAEIRELLSNVCLGRTLLVLTNS